MAVDLAQEASAAKRGAEILAQHLHGDFALVLEVLGEVNGRHATRAELALDAIAVGEGCSETRHPVRGHLIPAAAMSRFTSSVQLSTMTGSATAFPALGFTNMKFFPSGETSKFRTDWLPLR